MLLPLFALLPSSSRSLQIPLLSALFNCVHLVCLPVLSLTSFAGADLKAFFSFHISATSVISTHVSSATLLSSIHISLALHALIWNAVDSIDLLPLFYLLTMNPTSDGVSETLLCILAVKLWYVRFYPHFFCLLA